MSHGSLSVHFGYNSTIWPRKGKLNERQQSQASWVTGNKGSLSYKCSVSCKTWWESPGPLRPSRCHDEKGMAQERGESRAHTFPFREICFSQRRYFLPIFSSKTAEISVDCLIENPENCIWRKSLLSGFCNFHFKMWHLVREGNINSEFKTKLGFTYSCVHPLITLSLHIIYPKPQNINIIPFGMVPWSFYDDTARLAYTEKHMCSRNIRCTVPEAGKAMAKVLAEFSEGLPSGSEMGTPHHIVEGAR